MVLHPQPSEVPRGMQRQQGISNFHCLPEGRALASGWCLLTAVRLSKSASCSRPTMGEEATVLRGSGLSPWGSTMGLPFSSTNVSAMQAIPVGRAPDSPCHPKGHSGHPTPAHQGLGSSSDHLGFTVPRVHTAGRAHGKGSSQGRGNQLCSSGGRARSTLLGTGCPRHPENLPPASLWDGAHCPCPPKGQSTDRAQIFSNSPLWAHRTLTPCRGTLHTTPCCRLHSGPASHCTCLQTGCLPHTSAQLGDKTNQELTPHSPSPGQDTRGTAVGMEL